jgi:hypothetical protein
MYFIQAPINYILFRNMPVQYTVKKASRFPSPAGISLTKFSLGGNNYVIYKLFPPRESLVSDIPAGNGNIEKPFLRCTVLRKPNITKFKMKMERMGES